MDKKKCVILRVLKIFQEFKFKWSLTKINNYDSGALL